MVAVVLSRGRTLAVLSLIALTLAAVDLIARGRSAFLEGEKYMRWSSDPRLQRDYYQREFEARSAEIERERKEGRMDDAEAKQRVELLAVERDERINEEPLKYATHWFKTAHHLFSPPKTRWTAQAVQREKAARDLWRKKLQAAGQKFDERWLE